LEQWCSNWEREERLWEAEEEKKWSYVSSKWQARQPKWFQKPKKVRFAANLEQQSPAIKSSPSELRQVVRIGSLFINIPTETGNMLPTPKTSGILKNIFSEEDESSFRSQSKFSRFSSGFSPVLDSQSLNPHVPESFLASIDRHNGSTSKASKLKPVKQSFKSFIMTNRLHLGGCTRCFEENHNKFSCRSIIRCATCFNLGHSFKYCLTRSKPRICWRPKVHSQPVQNSLETERPSGNSQPSSKCEESPPPASNKTNSRSVSSPNRRAATENTPSLLEPTLNQDSSPPVECGSGEDEMANFDVDPIPFVLEGMNVEEWV
jgi:hypothetical protein